MKNQKLSDFDKAKEDEIESISNDESHSQTLAQTTNTTDSTLNVIDTVINRSNSAGKTKQHVTDSVPTKRKKQKLDEQNEPDAVDAVVVAPPNQNRCDKCHKKLGLTGGFSCRCGGTFCAFHRYSDRHECSFDYREMGASEIRRDNPLVVPEKLRKV